MLRLLKILPWVIFVLCLSLCSCRKKDPGEKAINSMVGSWECSGTYSYRYQAPMTASRDSTLNMTCVVLIGKKGTGSNDMAVTALPSTELHLPFLSGNDALPLRETHKNGDTTFFYWSSTTNANWHFFSAVSLFYLHSSEEIGITLYDNDYGGNYHELKLHGNRN